MRDSLESDLSKVEFEWLKYLKECVDEEYNKRLIKEYGEKDNNNN